ncbi:MAG: hypothetical protein RI883_2268 [Bacteroidota bacterium]|jgi:hypothetical protein
MFSTNNCWNEKINLKSLNLYMRYLALLVIILLSVSCKKGKADFVLKGTVSDLTFNQNLSGATIKLYQVPVGTTQKQLLSTSTIESDGAYSFTFPRDKMEKYVVSINKTNYFEITEDVYFSSLTTSEDNVRDFSTKAKAWVKLTFFNSNPLPSDQLKYIKQTGKEGCAECCSDAEQILFGTVNTSIYCINDANTDYSYYYWLLGTSNQGLKSAYTNAFDTVEISLTY